MVYIPAGQDAESGVTLLPADWESRCLPPPVLYNIIAKVWRDPDPDALEDDMYVGEVAIFVNEVPTEVPEAALHKWLSVGLDENADGLHEAKNQLKEVEEELVALELIIERFSMEPYDDSDEDERKKRQDRSMRLELGHLELLAKLLALQKRVEEAYATAPSSHPELFELKLDGPSTVTRQNFWLVRFQDSDSGKWFAYCAAHKMDWNATRLALNKVTGIVMRS